MIESRPPQEVYPTSGLSRHLLPACSAAAAILTALTTWFFWLVLEGLDAPAGYERYARFGWQVEQGRWLIALSLAGLVWVIAYFRKRDPFIALTGVAFATAALGVSIWAISDFGAASGFGADATAPVVASSIWLAIALLVVRAQWRADGQPRPIVVEIVHDFRFAHFLTTSFVGLLWSLALAAATTGVFAAVIQFWHEESLVLGLLAGLAALLVGTIWLLWVRLILEAIVVLFRIYDELRSSNARHATSSSAD